MDGRWWEMEVRAPCQLADRAIAARALAAGILSASTPCFRCLLSPHVCFSLGGSPFLSPTSPRRLRDRPRNLALHPALCLRHAPAGRRLRARLLVRRPLVYARAGGPCAARLRFHCGGRQAWHRAGGPRLRLGCERVRARHRGLRRQRLVRQLARCAGSRRRWWGCGEARGRAADEC